MNVLAPHSGCANRRREGITINIDISLLAVIRTIFRVYYFLIIANVLLSWFRVGDNVLTRFIHEMTEPVLGFFRRLIPLRIGLPIDFSPIFAIIALELLETAVIRFLISI